MKKDLLKIMMLAVLVFIFSFFLDSGLSYGEVQIQELTIFPSLPEPDQEVILKLKFSSSRPFKESRIRLFDIFEKEIATREITEDFSLKSEVEISFKVPKVQGRYNYNVRVAIDSENRFINIPVSSEPVTSVIVEDVSAQSENGKIQLSFLVKNNGNRTIENLKISVVINPVLSVLALQDVAEGMIGEEVISSLKRDASERISMDFYSDKISTIPDKHKNVFSIGIKISGINERPYWKIEKFEMKSGVVFPLHSVGAHTFYTEHAIEIFPESSPIYKELNLYREQIISGSHDEDYPPDLVYNDGLLLYIHHFLDYDNHPFYYGLYGTGLHITGIPNYVESSYEKAMAYWDGWTSDSVYHPGIIELYLGIGLPFPDKITAYEYLGRICHLIEDNLTPAHVHSDIHGILIDDDEFEEVFEPGIDPLTGSPRYEKYDENSAVWAYWRDYIGKRNILDLAELFTKMNQHADYFPSDDYQGDDLNFSNPWNIPKLYTSDIIKYDLSGDHFKLPGMQRLADWISPLNVMSCASACQYFWDHIK